MLDSLPPAYNVVAGIIRYKVQTTTLSCEVVEDLLLSEELTLTRQNQQQEEMTALLSQ